jgi:porin
MIKRNFRQGLATAILLAASSATGWAQGLPSNVPIDAAPGQANAGAQSPGFLTGIMRRENLLGDMGGVRTVLGRYGISVQLTDSEELLGNVSGGAKRGATYDALTTLTVQMDTQKAFGWEGGLFNVSALQIRGRSLSQYYLYNLQTVSGISATPTTRLWEAWYQQSFLDGKLDVKFGQQSIDQEFMASAGSALYLNTMMGWPMVPSANLYAGGPAYPLSSLGVRVRGQVGPFTLLGGVFQDNPPGGPFADDSQLRGTSRWGGNFNLRTGALAIVEIQYAHNLPANGDMDDGSRTGGLPGTYKLGAWFDSAAFPSQRYDSSGLSLADPASTGNPRMLRRNYSVYAVADQMVWQSQDDDGRSVSLFARAMIAPGDRNLVDFSVNAGVNLKAPLPGRGDDTFGLGFGFTTVSNGARGLDRDTAFFSGPSPVRSHETFLEATYQVQVTPWIQIQPDLQYIMRPGGGISNPNNPGQMLKNELVVGVRTNITF